MFHNCELGRQGKRLVLYRAYLWQVDPCGALTLRLDQSSADTQAASARKGERLRLHQPGLLQREARLRMRRESIAARLCYEKERMNTSRIRIYLCP